MGNPCVSVFIGEHVVQQFNDAFTAGIFSQQSTARRRYAPRAEAEDLANLEVNVITWLTDEKSSSRGLDSIKVAVWVEVAKQVEANGDDLTALDGLAGFVSEVGRFLAVDMPLVEGINRQPQDKQPPLYVAHYDPEFLLEFGVFCGIVQCHFSYCSLSV